MPQSRTSKPVLAIDFDDTVALNAYNLIEAYNREFATDLKLENIYLPGELGNRASGWKHDLEGSLEWIHEYLTRPSVLEQPPVPGARASLARLKKRFHLTIVTGRLAKIDHIMDQWLGRHMPGCIDDIYHTGETPKSVVCYQIGARMLIDDSPSYIADCHAAGIDVLVFGDYPWNQADRLPQGAKRAKDWAEVEAVLR